MEQYRDKYREIRQRLMELTERDRNIRAVIAFGSSTRDTEKADVYSDLDLMIITEDTDAWLYGDLPDKLGDLKISFVEPTLGGGKERRVLYRGNLDVDMIILSEAQLAFALAEGSAGQVMSRGYVVLYDAMGISDMLNRAIASQVHPPGISREGFLNLVNDFYFHVVWMAKKLLRGELWSAKMCLDAYLKTRLLQVIELYTASKYHKDVWHDGRFLDQWADAGIRAALGHCFAHYEKADMQSALCATEELFAKMARETARIRAYPYPGEAEKTAEQFIRELGWTTSVPEGDAEQFYALELRMWEAARRRDPEAFLQVVSPEAVMICGGYRCTGAEYARLIGEFDCASFSLEQFELVNRDAATAQVHYVIRTEVSNPENRDLAGTFHVTTTWRLMDGAWRVVCNMDQRVS